MMDMKKEKLAKRLALNGWEITEEFEDEDEEGYIVYFLNIKSKNTNISFEFCRNSNVYECKVIGKGRKKVNKEVFFFIIEYIKEKKKDKPIAFKMERLKSTEAWNNRFESFFKTENYQKINELDVNFTKKVFLGHDSSITCYTTKKDLKLLKKYANYLSEIEGIVKEYKDKDFVFCEKNPAFFINDLNGFFFSVKDYRFVVQLNIEDDLLKICIRKENDKGNILKQWNLYEKNDIKKYLKKYIKQTEKNQRIRNMYGNSLFFFKYYCKYFHIIPQQELYDKLLHYYTKEEIEFISTEIWKCDDKTKTFLNYSAHRLTFFGNIAIYFNIETNELKFLSNEQEINQYIEEIEKNIS